MRGSILISGCQALLSVFKGRLLDRRDGATAVERCEVHVQDQPDKAECRLVIKMVCRHGRHGPVCNARVLTVQCFKGS